MTFSFFQVIVKTYIKTANFQVLPETTNFSCQNKYLSDATSILILFKTVIYKIDESAKCLGGTSGKIELKLEKIPIFQGLRQGIFPVCP